VADCSKKKKAIESVVGRHKEMIATRQHHARRSTTLDVVLLLLLLLLAAGSPASVSSFQFNTSPSRAIWTSAARTKSSASTVTVTTPRTTTTTRSTASTSTSLYGIVKPYEHHGYKLSYRYRPGQSADPAVNNGPPLILIHPIGIGLSSWFWKQFINYWDGTNELLAPDLLGCGLENGNDEWNPAAEVMLRPDKSTTLAYTEAIETLLQQRIVAKAEYDFVYYGQQHEQKCVVVSQGGLAPVALELAARNPDLVSHLVLISPPTWAEMINPLPSTDRAKKYRAYTSPMSYMTYDALERPFGFRTYMQRYFKRRPDDQFVSFATEGARVTKLARAAVASYNSGALFDRSYEHDLRMIEQPTLILCGTSDAQRTEQRESYLFEMQDAAMAMVEGKMMLPWESPVEVRNAIKAFVREHPDRSASDKAGTHMEDPALAMTGQNRQDYQFKWGTYGEESSGGAILNEIASSSNGEQMGDEDAAENAINGIVKLNMPPPMTYELNGHTLTYREKPAAPGHEFDPTLLLIHGIGIGQSSWFWEKIFQRYKGAIIAPDLIGCGLENGGDPWDPLKRDVEVPLDWVEGIERLMQNKGFDEMHRCVVVAQNGVAPIGIKLAYRNEATVSHLILLSPPCWERLTSAFTSEEERQRRHRDNIGSAAEFYFNYLESKIGYRMKIREFFKEKPDDRFISLATAKGATRREARTPIIAMNSGDLNYRSFEAELTALVQPVLTMTGGNDRVYTDKRPGFGLGPYSTKMNNEKTVIINGKTMLPWESPDAVLKEIRTFLGLKDDGEDETGRSQDMFIRARRQPSLQ